MNTANTNKDNIENICTNRTARKRSLSNSSNSTFKRLAKAKSPSPSNNLEEMGIGVLESEDSVSPTSDMLSTQNLFFCVSKDSGLGNCNVTRSNDQIYQQNVPSTLPLELRNDTHMTNSHNKLDVEKFVRSPLATVEYNVVLNQHSHKAQTNDQDAPRSTQTLLSLPSTSQHAKLLDQQQEKPTLQKPPTQQFLKSFIYIIPKDEFFVYRKQTVVENTNTQKDLFGDLSDEIILQIFKWLPKKTLLRCGMVSQRFNRCANDESLWTRLDLAGILLKSGAVENIFKRGVVILRLAQTEFVHPVFEERFLKEEPNFESKVQYLDLSMAMIKKESLKMLLSRCRMLKKLSLEHVPLNDDVCTEISKNTQLETLNLAMCSGIEAWSVRKMFTALTELCSLNISWTNLSVDAVTSLVTVITPQILRLNLAGCRKTMFDSHLNSLAKRCPQLLELDISDCTALTSNATTIISAFKELEYLSLSRCYGVGASSFISLQSMPSLAYLDIFGVLTDSALGVLRETLEKININQFIHSSVARPTVGTRRTSIWGLRTRDFHT